MILFQFANYKLEVEPNGQQIIKNVSTGQTCHIDLATVLDEYLLNYQDHLIRLTALYNLSLDDAEQFYWEQKDIHNFLVDLLPSNSSLTVLQYCKLMCQAYHYCRHFYIQSEDLQAAVRGS